MIDNPQTPDRRERYAVAIHDAMEPDLSLVDQEPGCQALFARAAEAAVTLADSEQAELRRERDLAIAHDRQPYPTAWAYEQACKAREKHRERADAAEAKIGAMRADVLREVADICDEAASAYAERGADDVNSGATTAASALFGLMERFQRKADEAEYVATPCDSMVPCEDGGEPCHVHERLMAHSEGEHELCEPDCGVKPAVVPAVPGPPATHATDALRDRIQLAIHSELTEYRLGRDTGLIVQRLTDAALRVLSPDADRGSDLLKAADALDANMERFFAEWPDEAQQPAECSPACSEQHTYSPGCALALDEAQPETDEQRADREETERDHASGNHEYCGVTCEAEFPTAMLRNGILAKGYPGTAGMLDELLRRARAGRQL